MNSIIKEVKDGGMTYSEYRNLVTDLLKENKSTGNTQTENYLGYSKLGNARMKRLDKTFHLSDDVKAQLNNTSKKYQWLVLTEGWCGDAGHALPIMNKIAEASENIDLKILLRDENDALMNQFLTDGNRSIPKLIVLDKATDEVVDTWGPRPSEATAMVSNYKKENGSLSEAFKEELQVWYNTNKGENILRDLMALVA